MTFGLVQSWDTGTPYGAAGTIRTASYVTNPGYQTPPASETYYFTGRDAYRTEDVWRTDLQLYYSHRIVGGLEIFVQPQVFNVLQRAAHHRRQHDREHGLQHVEPRRVQPVHERRARRVPAGNGLLATCKAMGANWQKGSLFGQPTAPTSVSSQGSFQVPRYFSMSVGLRF